MLLFRELWLFFLVVDWFEGEFMCFVFFRKVFDFVLDKCWFWKGSSENYGVLFFGIGF